jgi:hypothetical protein
LGYRDSEYASGDGDGAACRDPLFESPELVITAGSMS